MSKCSICDSGLPREPNPNLCGDCQDWDDLQHVASCLTKQGKFEPLNPVLFSYKHNPWWPPAQKNNYANPEDLKYRGLHDFSGSGKCFICAAVRHALQAQETTETKCKIAVWKPFVYDPCDDHRMMPGEAAVQNGMLPTIQKVVLAVVLATSSRSKDDWAYAPRILHLNMRYEQWCHALSAVSPWQRKRMNYKQVEAWLDRCVHGHGPDCNALRTPDTMRLPSAFRLVDTHDWCVVRMAEPGDYVALSYVWALASDSAEKQKLQLQQDNIQAMETPGGLRRDMLPEVLVDAIELSAELGQRYLWIDRLCIVQDDHETKAEQLDAMGLIYHQAFLTLVALGDGITRGLPGVSSRPRPDSYINRSWDLLATMRNPMGDARVPWIEQAVQDSKWNDRAWTFQERYLSRRSLYFDEGQVYGSCCRERWADNSDAYQDEKWMSTAYWQDEGLGDSLSGKLQDSLEAYTGPLRQYTPRSLTFQDDILNAFAGVGSILRRGMGTEVLCGHPEKFFLESLLWIPNDDGGQARNVPSVPTWSWASCMAGVEWTKDWVLGRDTHNAAVPGAEAALVDFHVADPRAPSGLRRIVHRALPQELDDAVDWWPPRATMEPQARATLAELALGACALAARTPNSLVFNTAAARLRLQPFGVQWHFIPPRRNRTGCYLSTADGENVGFTMRMSPGLASHIYNCCSSPEKEFTVVALGAGVAARELRKSLGKGGSGKSCKGSDWAILVMVASEDEQGVLRRVAIGAVYPDLWMKANPEWRTVVIG